MKNSLYLPILSFLIFCISGCSVEKFDTNAEEKFKSIDRDVSFKRFLNETNIKNFNNIKTSKSSNNTASHQRILLEQFYVDTTKIYRYQTPENDVTYTFKLHPLNETLAPNNYYNLVYENKNNQWNELIFKNKDSLNIQTGKTEIVNSELKFINSTPVANRFRIVEIITYVFHCTKDRACSNGCDMLACPTGECFTKVVSYDIVDDNPLGGNTSGGNSGGGPGAGGNAYDGIFIPNPYSNSDDPLDPDFIFDGQINAFINTLKSQNPNITTLIANDLWLHANIFQFIKSNGGLTRANTDAVRLALINCVTLFNINFSNSTFIEVNQLKFSIFNYLLQNPTPIAVNFVNQFVLNYANYPDLNLNFDDSVKSPANIDLKTIDNSPAGLKFKCVYNKLMGSPAFKNLIDDTFGGIQTRLNIKFTLVPSFSNPSTKATTQLTIYPNGTLSNKIEVSSAFLTDSNISSISVAKTILHEVIHAFLNIKKYNSQAGASVPEINNLDFPEIINSCYNNFNGVSHPTYGPQDQHEFMFDYMIPVFQRVLTDIRDSLITAAEKTVAEASTFNNTVTNNAQAPWNWNDFYKFLSIAGLHNSTASINAFSANTEMQIKDNFYFEKINNFKKECD